MYTLVLLSLTAAQVHDQHHPPRSATEYAHVLDDPKRDEWQKPHESVTALALRNGEVIADIGAGTGYFALRFANHAAKVYAVDIEPKLLEMINAKKKANVTTVLAAPDDPKLPDAGVDTVFFCNVVHHIENRAAYWAKVTKALKPGGRVIIMDFHKRELPVGPPPSMKIEKDAMVKELAAAGFHVSNEWTFLPYQYFIELRK